MKAQTLGRILLGSAMVGAGVLHLTTQREEFRAQVPDWFPVDEDLTGWQNLELFGTLLDLGRAGARRRAAELLEWFDLTDAADRIGATVLR